MGGKKGHIELPKAVKGHVTYTDGKMLSVTNYFPIFSMCNETSPIVKFL